MSQIEANKLETISNTSSEVVGIINEGLTWVNQALKGENRRGTKNSVKSCRRTLNKIKAVVTEKPTIALFGASQVGKSYMANNLLYNEDNTLLVVNHKAENDPSNSGKGKEIDFLVYLNPEGGGKEATATVTRFTSDKIEDADTLPVKVKLFDIKDILCILCDTYGSEFKDSASLMNEDGIKAHIEELKGYLSNEKQFLLSDDDVYEVKEYL